MPGAAPDPQRDETFAASDAPLDPAEREKQITTAVTRFLEGDSEGLSLLRHHLSFVSGKDEAEIWISVQRTVAGFGGPHTRESAQAAQKLAYEGRLLVSDGGLDLFRLAAAHAKEAGQPILQRYALVEAAEVAFARREFGICIELCHDATFLDLSADPSDLAKFCYGYSIWGQLYLDTGQEERALRTAQAIEECYARHQAGLSRILSSPDSLSGSIFQELLDARLTAASVYRENSEFDASRRIYQDLRALLYSRNLAAREGLVQTFLGLALLEYEIAQQEADEGLGPLAAEQGYRAVLDWLDEARPVIQSEGDSWENKYLQGELLYWEAQARYELGEYLEARGALEECSSVLEQADPAPEVSELVLDAAALLEELQEEQSVDDGEEPDFLPPGEWNPEQ